MVAFINRALYAPSFTVYIHPKFLPKRCQNSLLIGRVTSISCSSATCFQDRAVWCTFDIVSLAPRQKLSG